jgi:hypothetical protein
MGVITRFVTRLIFYCFIDKFFLESPRYVEKILDIQAGELCYMLGTIYLEMTAKPNVMNNLQDEASIFLCKKDETLTHIVGINY